MPTSATACASFCGSSGSSGGAGNAVFTAQNLQARVQVSPITMNVAVPPFQHSGMFGQCASSQTVWSLCLLRISLMPRKGSLVSSLILSHSGFASCRSAMILVMPKRKEIKTYWLLRGLFPLGQRQQLLVLLRAAELFPGLLVVVEGDAAAPDLSLPVLVHLLQKGGVLGVVPHLELDELHAQLLLHLPDLGQVGMAVVAFSPGKHDQSSLVVGYGHRFSPGKRAERALFKGFSLGWEKVH